MRRSVVYNTLILEISSVPLALKWKTSHMKSWWDCRAVRTHSNLLGLQNGTAIKYFGYQFLRNTGVGSLSLLQWIFSIQESDWGLPHCRWVLSQLSYQGSLYIASLWKSRDGKNKLQWQKSYPWWPGTGMGATLWVDGHILWLPVLVAVFIKAYQSGHLKPMHFIGFSLYLNSDDLKGKQKYLSLRIITRISVKIWLLKMLNKYGWFWI